MNVEWRDIKDYEGQYQCSSDGQFRSVDRVIIKQGRVHKLRGRILKLGHNPNTGYSGITFSKNGETKTKDAHRVIASTFIPNPNSLPQINHINGVKTDNRVINLEWCNDSQNKIHGYKLGLRTAPALGKFGIDNKLHKKISQHLLSGELVKIHYGIANAMRETGVKSIGGCLSGRQHHAGGFIWKYL